MEADNMAKEKGADFAQEVHYAAHRSSGVLGNIIVTILKIFMYIVLGSIAFAIIVALFALAIAAIGLFPLKDFVLTDGWQTALAWGTLLFFIAVPVIGIITFIIRRFARVKTTNKLMRYSFISLWILGIVCFVGLITSVGRDFKSFSSLNEESIYLQSPTVQSLEVMPFQNINYRRIGWFNLEPFGTFGTTDDTAFIGNVRIRIIKSPTDSFQVSIVKMSNGNTRRYADTLKSLINFHVSQNDSLLMMDRAITINTTDKFRNQYVEATIAVPVGHRIKINKTFGYGNRVRFGGFWGGNEWYYYNNDNINDYDFSYGIEYIMKDDGLYTLSGHRSDRNNDDWNDNSSNDNNTITPPANSNGSGYRYNQSKIDSLKDAQEKQILKMQSSLDSAKSAREKEIQRLTDSLKKSNEEINQKIEKLKKGTAISPASCQEKFPDTYSFIMHI
jgi:heme/copper-type cytochrome/quinol oxidase subunit 2